MSAQALSRGDRGLDHNDRILADRCASFSPP
jgi:hypothetical protein